MLKLPINITALPSLRVFKEINASLQAVMDDLAKEPSVKPIDIQHIQSLIEAHETGRWKTLRFWGLNVTAILVAVMCVAFALSCVVWRIRRCRNKNKAGAEIESRRLRPTAPPVANINIGGVGRHEEARLLPEEVKQWVADELRTQRQTKNLFPPR